MDKSHEVAPHGFVSLREYVDVRFNASKEAINAALASADRAVAKAEMASDKRFDNTNEWRGTLESLQRNYPTRSEVTQSLQSLTDKIEALQKILWVGLGVVLGIQFLLGIALIVFLHK